MTLVLSLLAVQGSIGAFDTLYYHEWRAKLPARVPGTAPELRLHAVRDFLYAVLFGTLPWLAWHGFWALLLAGILLTEIVLTLADFVIEIRVRKPIGDVYPGERVTHAVMGIIYGAMVANLLPIMWRWWSQPTSLARATSPAPVELCWLLTVMAAGVFLSGVRDLYASLQLPQGGWPWNIHKTESGG